MKFKNTVSLKLQRALHDPSRGIKGLTCTCVSSFCDLGKVKPDVGGSTDSVFTSKHAKNVKSSLLKR